MFGLKEKSLFAGFMRANICLLVRFSGMNPLNQSICAGRAVRPDPGVTIEQRPISSGIFAAVAAGPYSRPHTGPNTDQSQLRRGRIRPDRMQASSCAIPSVRIHKTSGSLAARSQPDERNNNAVRPTPSDGTKRAYLLCRSARVCLETQM